MGSFFSKQPKVEPPILSPLLLENSTTPVPNPRLGEPPSFYEFALMSYLAYDTKEIQTKLWSPVYQSRNYLARRGWTIIKTIKDDGGYCAVALINHLTHQVVVAHRGTVPAELATVKTDIDLMNNKITQQQVAAESFTRQVLDGLKTPPQTQPPTQSISVSNKLTDYQLWFTGHSLGGWLAQLSVSRFKEAMLVVFDSPGAMEMIQKTQGRVGIAGQGLSEEEIRNFPATNIVSAPNIVNTCGEKIGRVLRIFIIPEPQDQIMAWFKFNFEQHSLNNIIDSVNPANPNFTRRPPKIVLRWPQLEWGAIKEGGETAALGLFSMATGNLSEVKNVISGIRSMFDGDKQRRDYYGYTNDAAAEPVIEKLTYKEQYLLQCKAKYETLDIDPLMFDLSYVHPQIRQFLENFLAYGAGIIKEDNTIISADLQRYLFAYQKVQGASKAYRAAYRVCSNKLPGANAEDFLKEIHYQVYALGENLNALLEKLAKWRDTNPIAKLQELETRLKQLEGASGAYQFLATQANNIIRNLLIQNYKSKTTIQCLFANKTFDIDSNFINLSVIDKESFHAKEKKLKEGKADFENLYKSDAQLDLDNLFPRGDDKEESRRVLLTARAGNGKTTTCKYIVRGWAEEKLWQDQFDYIFWIPLRNINVQNYPKDINLLDVVLRECLSGLDSRFNFERDLKLIEIIKREIETNSNRVLWILDGYDEVLQLSMEHTAVHIENFINDILLHRSRYLLTSRPYYLATQKLNLKKEIVILGFNDKNVHQYIDKFFAKQDEVDYAAEMKNILRVNHALLELVNTPFYLEILCSIIAQNTVGDLSEHPPTIAKLYNQLLASQIKRKLVMTRGTQVTHADIVSLYADATVSAPLNCMMYMAHDNHNKGIILTDAARVTYIMRRFQQGSNLTPMITQVLAFGFIKGIDAATGQVDESKKSYYFHHLTLAEYFSALEIVRHLLDPRKRTDMLKAIEKHKYDPRYENVFGFMVGILVDEQNSIYADFNTSDIDDADEREETVHARRNEILLCLLNTLEEPNTNWAHISVLMRYWQEIGDSPIREELQTKKQQFLQSLQILLTQNIEGQNLVLHYELVRFLRANSSMLEQPIVQGLLTHPNPSQKLKSIYMARSLYKLSPSAMQSMITTQVQEEQKQSYAPSSKLAAVASANPAILLAARITYLLLPKNQDETQLDHQCVQQALVEYIVSNSFPWPVILLELKHLNTEYPDERYAENTAKALTNSLSRVQPQPHGSSSVNAADDRHIIGPLLQMTKEFSELSALIETVVIPHLLDMLNKHDNVDLVWNLIYRCLAIFSTETRNELIQKYLNSMLEGLEREQDQPVLNARVLSTLIKLLPAAKQQQNFDALHGIAMQRDLSNKLILMSQLEGNQSEKTVLLATKETTVLAAEEMFTLFLKFLAYQPLSDSESAAISGMWEELAQAAIISEFESHMVAMSYRFRNINDEITERYARIKAQEKEHPFTKTELEQLDRSMSREITDIRAVYMQRKISILHELIPYNFASIVSKFIMPITIAKEIKTQAQSKFYMNMLLCLINFIVPIGNKILLNYRIKNEELHLFICCYIKIKELKLAFKVSTFEDLFGGYNPNSSKIDFKAERFYFDRNAWGEDRIGTRAIASHYLANPVDVHFLFLNIQQNYMSYRHEYHDVAENNSFILKMLQILFNFRTAAELTDHAMTQPSQVLSILDAILTIPSQNRLSATILLQNLRRADFTLEVYNGYAGRHPTFYYYTRLFSSSQHPTQYVRAIQQFVDHLVDNDLELGERKKLLASTDNIPYEIANILRQQLTTKELSFSPLLNPTHLIQVMMRDILSIQADRKTLETLDQETRQAWKRHALAAILCTIYEYYQDNIVPTSNKMRLIFLALGSINAQILFELTKPIMIKMFVQDPIAFMQTWASTIYYVPYEMSWRLSYLIIEIEDKKSIISRTSTTEFPSATFFMLYNYLREYDKRTDPMHDHCETLIKAVSSFWNLSHLCHGENYDALVTHNGLANYFKFHYTKSSTFVNHNKILTSHFATQNTTQSQSTTSQIRKDAVDIKLLITQMLGNTSNIRFHQDKIPAGKIGVKAQFIRHLVNSRAIFTQEGQELHIKIAQETTTIKFSRVADAKIFSTWIQDNLNLTQLYTAASNTITQAWQRRKSLPHSQVTTMTQASVHNSSASSNSKPKKY